MRRAGLLLGILLFCGQADAERHTGAFFAIDLGAYGTNLYTRFSIPDAYRSQVSNVSAFLRLRTGLPLGKGFFFEPALGMLLPWRSGADGNTKTYTGHLDLAFYIPLFSFLGARLGPGIQSVATTSSGEAVTLNNGTSTSTFYTPSKFSNSIFFTVQGGLVFTFSPRICFSLEAYIPSVASRARREVNGAGTLGFTL